MHPPLTPSDWTAIVVLLLVTAVLLWMLPSCGEEACTTAHRGHVVKDRAAAIEKEHATFHGESQPIPTCALCQARRRDRDDPR